jgi:hypothetical protein
MSQVDFEIKNQRRREVKQADSGNYRQGRHNRRVFAWNGAFGKEVARVYNDCALGTSAPQRLVKQGKDEYDNAEDYDL